MKRSLPEIAEGARSALWLLVVLAGVVPLGHASAVDIANARASKFPISIVAVLRAAPNPDDKEAELQVTLEIVPPWHVYADAGTNLKTEILVILPPEMRPVSDWVTPKPAYLFQNGARTRIYEGRVTFSRKLRTTNGPSDGQLTVQVSYQACTAEICNMPDSVEVELKIGHPSAEGLKKPAK